MALIFNGGLLLGMDQDPKRLVEIYREIREIKAEIQDEILGRFTDETKDGKRYKRELKRLEEERDKLKYKLWIEGKRARL